MKKSLLSVFFAFILTSCSMSEVKILEKEQSGFVSGEAPVFMASFGDEAMTKTYLDEQEKLRWHANDELTVFPGVLYNQKYAFDGADGAERGSFSIVGELPENIDKINANYAVYPYNQNTSLEKDGILTVSLPDYQGYNVGNSFGKWSNTMVAVTENISDNNFSFKNVCGYLKLSLWSKSKVSLKKITLSGNKNEKISGNAKIIASYEAVPTLTMEKDAGTSVSIVRPYQDLIPLGVTEEEAFSFYFVLPPVVFENGITVSFTFSDNKEVTKSTTKPITIERNKISTMNAIDPFDGIVKFDDPKFKSFCLAKFNTNGDDNISYEEAAVVTEMYCQEEELTSLEGIQYFTALKKLYCDKNKLTSLDLSKNTELEFLSCYGNNLTMLNVSGCRALESLECYQNQLNVLDVSQNKALKTLDCKYNNNNGGIDALDVSGNPVLEVLNVSGNKNLTVLDVSKNVLLKKLDCAGNNLTTLDVSQNPALVRLWATSNPNLTEIWLKKGQLISELGYNEVTTIRYK